MSDDSDLTAVGPQRRSVATQSTALAAASGVGQVLVAIMYILAARAVSPGEFGVVASTIAISLVISGFVDFGTNSYWIREVARSQLAPDDLSRRIATKVLVSLVGSLFVSIALASLTGNADYLVLFPLGVIVTVNQASQVPLRALGRAELVGFATIADRAISLIVFLPLLFVAHSAVALPLALCAGPLVGALIMTRMTPPESRLRLVPPVLRNPWRGAFFYGLSSSAVTAQSLDITLLAAVAGNAATGSYGAVTRWTAPINLLAGAFASVLAPYSAQSSSISGLWRHAKRALWIPIAGIVAAIGLAILSPLLVPLLLGSAYQSSVGVLQLLAIGTIPAIVNQPLVVIMHSLGYDRASAIITAACVVIQLIAVIPLGASLGATGAALAYIGFQILLLAGHLVLIVALGGKAAPTATR